MGDVEKYNLKKILPSFQSPSSPDLTIYGDLVVLILEILNSILTHSLSQNPQLVYALLHRKELFVPFRGDDRFRELVGNVEMVTEYFQTKLLEANTKSPSAAEISGLIERVSKTWPKNKLQVRGERRERIGKVENVEKLKILSCFSGWQNLGSNMKRRQNQRNFSVRTCGHLHTVTGLYTGTKRGCSYFRSIEL